MNKSILSIGAVLGATAVVMGAFGAHALKGILTVDQLRAYHTGVAYQFYHVFAIMLCGLMPGNQHAVLLNRAAYLFLTGIVLFSGSLYCLTIFPFLQFLGIVTPLGGISFVAGWLFLAASFLKKR